MGRNKVAHGPENFGPLTSLVDIQNRFAEIWGTTRIIFREGLALKMAEWAFDGGVFLYGESNVHVTARQK